MPGSAVLSGLAFVSRLMQTICQYVLLVMLLITVGQIVARIVFSLGFPWAEEATRYLFGLDDPARGRGSGSPR